MFHKHISIAAFMGTRKKRRLKKRIDATHPEVVGGPHGDGAEGVLGRLHAEHGHVLFCVCLFLFWGAGGCDICVCGIGGVLLCLLEGSLCACVWGIVWNSPYLHTTPNPSYLIGVEPPEDGLVGVLLPAAVRQRHLFLGGRGGGTSIGWLVGGMAHVNQSSNQYRPSPSPSSFIFTWADSAERMTW